MLIHTECCAVYACIAYAWECCVYLYLPCLRAVQVISIIIAVNPPVIAVAVAKISCEVLEYILSYCEVCLIQHIIYVETAVLYSNKVIGDIIYEHYSMICTPCVIGRRCGVELWRREINPYQPCLCLVCVSCCIIKPHIVGVSPFCHIA